MKKQSKFNELDNDSVENNESVVGHTNSQHKYTPQSHDNLLRGFSKIRESGWKNHKSENKRLRAELKRVNEEVRKTQAEVRQLRSQITNVNSAATNESDLLDDGSGYSIQQTGETLRSHFNEVMRRYNSTLADKNRQIRALRDKLAQYENHHQQRLQEEQEQRSHPAVEAERLRRTNAALQVFRRDIDLVSTQLTDSPLDEHRLPCSSSRDRLVVEELRRRQRFGVVADLEAMGHKFFERLQFEEKLDKVHWELECRRHLECGGQCAPTCTYHQEFQMLEITRNNLLKALRDLWAASTHHGPLQALTSHTVQTLYKASPNITQSNSGSVRYTTSELPDK